MFEEGEFVEVGRAGSVTRKKWPNVYKVAQK